MDIKVFNEHRLKCEFLNEMRRRRHINRNSIVATEYVLGSTGRRADLSILHKGEHIGIEIKSQLDKLDRLPGQLSVYTACFDRVILVADEKHIENAEKLASVDVELWQFSNSGEFQCRREAQYRPAKKPTVAVRLLTEPTIKRLLKLPANEAASRTALFKQASELQDSVIYQAVADTFKQTFEMTSSRFWNYVGRKKIRQDALEQLSRFAPLRSEAQVNRRVAKEFWADWQEHARIALQRECA
ncbi:hypothetical protein DYI23_12865 [Roseibium polysiphoniae]|uniref:Sce7726 family protein n=1 Tax=Roseibium polysiphoniae TaxID=2571221 RepID=A0A944CEQ9_9HYPH|nr:sce7726 family protein [Roseibium polysiphoniae]MBS8261110.1 hypothetical protein [Roseibium polysiphoniae]